MKKKEYQKPALRAVKIQQTHIICTSDIHTLGTNLTDDDAINYGGGNAGAARVKGNSVDWDDWSE